MLKIIIFCDMIPNKEGNNVNKLLVDVVNTFAEREIKMRNISSRTNNSTYSYQETLELYNFNNDYCKNKDNKTTLFVVSNYIIDVVSYIRNLMRNPNYFKIESETVKQFSFNSTKLQKIIIISILEYLTECYFRENDYTEKDIDARIIENIIKNKNPIEDFTTLINRRCGFLIKYDFLKFGLTSPYNQYYNGDKKESLSKIFNNKFDNENMKFKLLSSEEFLSEVDKMMYSEMSNEFKSIILDVVIKFILYPPYELGLLLNKVKGDKIQDIKKDSEETQNISLNLLLFSSISMILTKLNGCKTSKKFIDIITEE